MTKTKTKRRATRNCGPPHDFISNQNKSRDPIGRYNNHPTGCILDSQIQNMIRSEVKPQRKKKIINPNFFKLKMNRPFKELRKKIEQQIGRQYVFPRFIQQIINNFSSPFVTERQFFYRLVDIRKYNQIWDSIYNIVDKQIQTINEKPIADPEKFEKIKYITTKIQKYLNEIRQSYPNKISQVAFQSCFGNTWKKEYKMYVLNLNKKIAQRCKRTQQFRSQMNCSSKL